MPFNTGENEETLKQQYNPEGSILRKAQLRMLEMMDYFDAVCRKLNIVYRIDGGNVLGAIRHGGFIPWDDDVDVSINKKDEAKLCKYLLENPHPQFVLQCRKTDPYFFNQWNVLRDTKSEYLQDSRKHNIRKYRGLQIDIFTEQNGTIPFLFHFARKISGLNEKYLVGKFNILAIVVFNFQKLAINPLCSFISKLWGNKNVVTYSYGIFWDNQYPKEILYPVKQIEYEGRLFPAPASPSDYLKITYGFNYMDLPSPENRNHHQANYRIDD